MSYLLAKSTDKKDTFDVRLVLDRGFRRFYLNEAFSSLSLVVL
jgi:hypothetical protein